MFSDLFSRRAHATACSVRTRDGQLSRHLGSADGAEGAPAPSRRAEGSRRYLSKQRQAFARSLNRDATRVEHKKTAVLRIFLRRHETMKMRSVKWQTSLNGGNENCLVPEHSIGLRRNARYCDLFVNARFHGAAINRMREIIGGVEAGENNAPRRRPQCLWRI